MAINRAQLAKELEPGLNALFGMEYSRYENEHAEIFDNETSDRAFEEEVMLVGFGEAAVKQEGSAVQFDTAQESFTARYTHETVALAFCQWVPGMNVVCDVVGAATAVVWEGIAADEATKSGLELAAAAAAGAAAGAVAVADGAAALAARDRRIHPSTNGCR